MKNLFFTVTFTDIFDGKLLFSWAKKYTFTATDTLTAKRALTLAKKEYFGFTPLPPHTLIWDELDGMAVRFDGRSIAAYVELFETLDGDCNITQKVG